MDGLFDDLVPKQVYGPGAAESGQQATPAQQGYAEAASHLRDPQAAPGTAANPSFDTPTQAGAPTSYHVNAQGQLNDPNPQVSMGIFDDLLPGGPTRAPTDEGLGLLKGVAEPIDRLYQGIATHPTTEKASDALATALPMFSAARAAEGGLIHNMAIPYIGRQEEAGVVPGKLGQFAGNVLDTAALPGGPMVSGAAAGAALSDKTDPMGIATDAIKGAIGGKLLHGVVGGLSSIVSPKVSPNVQTLLDAKIPLTPGQIAGGSLQRVEDAVTSIPIFGDVVGGAKLRSIKGLNLAVANRALAPIGETVPADVPAGREAISYAGDKLSDEYNKLIPTLKIQADPEFGEAIRNLGDMASDLPAEHAKMFGRFMAKTVMDKISPETGAMTGQAMKDAETNIGQRINRYRQSPAPADQDFADGLTQLQAELRAMVARNNPEAADQLSKLNEGWANLAIGETAASRLGAHEGMFTPAQLAGAVRQSSATVRKRGYARGDALMQDLSDAALDRLPSTVPDSGSPLRHAVEGAVALGVGKESGMPIVGRAGMFGTLLSAPYTKSGGQFTQSLMAGSRPAIAPHIAAILNAIKPIARASGAAALPALTSTNGYAPQ